MKATGKHWFEDWFNSPYYKLLYRHRDHQEAREFVGRLMRHLAVPVGGRVLDLACGRGRHSLELHRLGFQVIGLDLSVDSIEEARAHEAEGLEFFVHDMRQLFWADHFDAILNLFTSFGYFHDQADDQRTIDSVRDALRPGGVFVLDFLNVQRVIDRMVPEEEQVIDGVHFNITREYRDGIIEKSIAVRDGDTENVFKEEVDALDLAQFRAYLHASGLEELEVFGSYQLEPFDPVRSERLIITAKKPD